MKKLLSALAVGAALLVLTGCCCEKECSPKQKCVAQNSGSECEDGKKDGCKPGQTNAVNNNGKDGHNHKENDQPQSKKLSLR